MKLIDIIIYLAWGFPNDWVIMQQPVNAEDAGDVGSIPGSGRSPEGGHGNPLQYSCLWNPMDRGAWWATIDGVAELDMTEWLTLSLFKSQILSLMSKRKNTTYHQTLNTMSVTNIQATVILLVCKTILRPIWKWFEWSSSLFKSEGILNLYFPLFFVNFPEAVEAL